MSEKLTALVDAHLRGCLPHDVPPSHRRIVDARAKGSGRSQQIEANLIMFDGLPAVVRLTKWALGWSHRWFMDSAVYWENGRWNREPAPHPDLLACLTPAGRAAISREDGER